MAMQSMAELSKKMRVRTTQDKLLLSMHTNRSRPMLVFYIGSNLCEECSLEPGDKLDVMWDSEERKGVILKDENGKVLTVLDSSGGRGVLSFTWREGMPKPDTSNGPVEMEDVVVEESDQEINFSFPAERCSF